MVNRIWQHHFGRVGQTPTISGTRALPSHPNCSMVGDAVHRDRGWSVKADAPLIVSSEPTKGRRASRGPATGLDPVVAVSARRLSAEEIRDAILATSGDFDRRPAKATRFSAGEQMGLHPHTPFSAVVRPRPPQASNLRTAAN